MHLLVLWQTVVGHPRSHARIRLARPAWLWRAKREAICRAPTALLRQRERKPLGRLAPHLNDFNSVTRDNLGTVISRNSLKFS